MSEAVRTQTKRILDKRSEARHPTPPKFVIVVWNGDGKQQRTRGYLTDMSAGGFSAMLENPVSQGRLARIAISLGNIGLDDLGAISAGVRVTKCSYDEPYYKVGFQFETLVPRDDAKVKKAVRAFQEDFSAQMGR
jgi:c-di-GMP-binding flagellar brake protein YcgR